MDLSVAVPAKFSALSQDIFSDEPLKLPKPSFFTDALMLTLGELVNFRSDVQVSADLETVYIPVLRAAGIDPDTHPQILAGHWPIRGTGPQKNKGLYRKVQLCYRYRKENGFCHQTGGKRHKWGLTDQGVEFALRLKREALGDDTWFPDSNFSYSFLKSEEVRKGVQALALHLGHPGGLDFDQLIQADGLAPLQGEGVQIVDILQALDPEFEIPEIPSVSLFHPVVVDLLGEKTDYTANVGVLVDSVFKAEVLRRLGVDDIMVTSGAWPLTGKPSLHRQINLSLTKQKSDTPLCGEAKTIGVARGVYGLNEAGVKDALSRLAPEVVEKVEKVEKVDPEPVDTQPSVDDGAHLVRSWLNEQLSKGLLSTMHQVLSNKLAKSYNLGEIDDLINNYLADILASKAFQERIIRGDLPTHKTLASWALRRAYSKFRNAGKDAHERSLREANTSRERTRNLEGDLDREAIHHAVVEISTFGEHTPIHLVNTKEGQDSAMAGHHSGMPLLDVVDPLDAEDALTAALDKQRGLARLEKAVKAHKAGAPDRYWGIYDKVCDGFSCKEIADAEGVSRNRAASLTASLRDSLSDIRDDSERAAAIMEYVQEEPCSTLQDLESEFGYGLKVISRICDWLCESNWMECQGYQPKKSRRSIPTFLITQRGETLLSERADATEWDLSTHVII